MKSRRFILMLALMAFSLSSLYAQYQRKEHVIDVGLGVGLGFYDGGDYEGLRVPYLKEGWAKLEPVNEMFGLSLAYRIDRHWTVQLQGYHQRAMFKDSICEESAKYFYSSFWNMDATVEYNILEYIPASQDITNGSLTPFVGLGLGLSMFDKMAHPARVSVYNDEKCEWESQVVKANQFPGIDSLQLGGYAVASVGLKWHIADGFQLKAACNYQLHNGRDRRGVSVASERGGQYVFIGEEQILQNVVDIEGEGNMQLNWSHNITLSLSVLYALDFETVATGGRSAYKNNWRKNGMMWWDAMDNYKGGSKGRGARTMKRRKPLWLE